MQAYWSLTVGEHSSRIKLPECSEDHVLIKYDSSKYGNRFLLPFSFELTPDP